MILNSGNTFLKREINLNNIVVKNIIITKLLELQKDLMIEMEQINLQTDLICHF